MKIYEIENKVIYCNDKKYQFFNYPFLNAFNVENKEIEEPEESDQLFNFYIDFLENRFGVLQFKEEDAETWFDEIFEASEKENLELKRDFFKELNEFIKKENLNIVYYIEN